MDSNGDVIIIGGGFSGTMVAAQLAARGIASVLIDRSHRPGRGAAYATTDPLHRLNVPAHKMSAWPDRPADFEDFLAARGVGAPGGFARRADYGDYLAAILADAERSGRTRCVEGDVDDVTRDGTGWRIRLADGRALAGRSLVLATGNPEPEPPSALADVDPGHRIDRPWSEDARARLLLAAERREPVLIAGTSLTMIDVVLSLDAMGHRGPVTAVSRRGLVPLAHAAPVGAPLPLPELGELPDTVVGMSRWLRARALRETDWRQAVDSIRPLTQAWWQAAGLDEQRRFLRHARPWWDIHRHRIAPDIAGRIERMRQRGWLRVLAGRFTEAWQSNGDYCIGVAVRGGGRTDVVAGLVVDCTGPGSVLDQAPVGPMLGAGLARADAVRLGLEVDDGGALVGTADAWAIGTLARGTWWETTAVPDLRIKAQTIAERIAQAGSETRAA